MTRIIIKIGDLMKYWTILYRSFFFYTLITIVYRIMGKREIGELSIMDFIVSIFIAEMVAISIENPEKSILVSLIPILLLVIMQIIVSYISMKNNKARNILDGVPSVIIDKGKVNFKEMQTQRYNLDDLLTQLRNKSIKSIDEVDYAVLETSGKLSIFKKNEDKNQNYPLPLILDGTLDKKTLNQINKTESWLYDELRKQNTYIENIFYAFYKDKNLYIIEKDKIK